jgi:hypothetical protein
MTQRTQEITKYVEVMPEFKETGKIKRELVEAFQRAKTVLTEVKIIRERIEALLDEPLTMALLHKLYAEYIQLREAVSKAEKLAPAYINYNCLSDLYVFVKSSGEWKCKDRQIVELYKLWELAEKLHNSYSRRGVNLDVPDNSAREKVDEFYAWTQKCLDDGAV